MIGSNLKWSVHSSTEGHGLLGPPVSIREACISNYTWIFKNTLGLFHLTSQRGWSRPLYLHSCFIALSPKPDLCHLFALPFLPFSCFFFTESFVLFLQLLHHPRSIFFLLSCLTLACCLFFLWFLKAQEPVRKMKGWALVFLLSLCLCLAEPAGFQCVEEIEMRLTMLQLVLLWL